jgi:HK97 family phage portal protein
MAQMNFTRFLRKASPVWQIIVQGKQGSAAWSAFHQRKAAQLYSNIDTVFSCIDIISSGAAQAGFKVTKTDSKGNVEEVFNHPILQLLNRPSPMASLQEYLYAYTAWKLITGNSYQVLNNGDDANYKAPPSEVYILRSDRMKIVPGEKGIKRYEYGKGGAVKDFPVDNVSQMSNIIHSKTFHPADDFYGLSPMQAAAKNIDIYNSSLNWNKSLLDESCRPSGMFKWEGEGNPSPQQISEIRKQIDSVSGAESAGKPLFGGTLSFQQMSMSPKDVEFLAGKNMTMKDIARVYKVPPIILNIGSDATFSNMADARLALWDEAIIPVLNCLVNEFNYFLMPRYGNDGAKLQLDLTHVTSLEPRREMQWKRANEADFLTTNERRNIVGYEDTDGGDDVLVSASMVPLTFAIGVDESDTTTGEDSKKKVRG